jgi:ribosomal-protein-alanine N-acetyltransferase
MTAILETDRLSLRRWTLDDVEAAFALYRDPDVTRFLGEPLQNLDEAREIVRRIIDHYDCLGFGQWAVVVKEGEKLVGSCGLKLLDGGPRVEIAYHFATSVWGRGFATEAARACLAHGFDRYDLECVTGIADPANLASHRVLEKIGMIAEGMGMFYGRTVTVWSKTCPGRAFVASA